MSNSENNVNNNNENTLKNSNNYIHEFQEILNNHNNKPSNKYGR